MCQEGSRRSIPVLELQFPCVIGVGRESLAVPILMEMLESCVLVSKSDLKILINLKNLKNPRELGRRAGEVVNGDGGWAGGSLCTKVRGGQIFCFLHFLFVWLDFLQAQGVPAF